MIDLYKVNGSYLFLFHLTYRMRLIYIALQVFQLID